MLISAKSAAAAKSNRDAASTPFSPSPAQPPGTPGTAEVAPRGLPIFGSKLFVALAGLHEKFEAGFIHSDEMDKVRNNAGCSAGPTKSCELSVADLASARSLGDIGRCAAAHMFGTNVPGLFAQGRMRVST